MPASKRPERPLSPVIPYARQSIDASDVAAVVAALQSPWVTQGPVVERFEQALAERTGTQHAVAVSSGTAALHLACLGLGLGSGDVGLAPSITFAATANALRLAGAEVSFADVHPIGGAATPETFDHALKGLTQGARPRALLPVSFAGVVPELPRIAELAQGVGAFVIEDAAHSLGASYPLSTGGQSCSGSCQHTDAAILSFHPVKAICAGEGGAILTNDAVLARRIRRLRSHGIERQDRWRYNQVELGLNYRMTELQAALGLSQLQRLDAFLQRRQALAARYQAALQAGPFQGRIAPAHQGERSAWHLFVVHFAGAPERQAAYDFLHAHGVRVQVHYLPVYAHDYYAKRGHGPLPGAERYYAGCLSLPLYPDLSDEEQDRVIELLRDFVSRNPPADA